MRILSTLCLIGFITLQGFSQKRTIDVEGFSVLSFGISGNLYLTQGSNEKVEIDCSDEVFEKIEFELRGDRLVIKSKSNWGWNSGIRRSDVDIYITMKDIEELSLSGSGNLIGENQINSDELELSVSGSGDMDLDISADEVETRISGSGTIELEGDSKYAKARISGSGKVRADDLTVKTFEASISGSGSCYITVEEEVSASISGSGSVYYDGDPERVISNSSGSGKIRKM